MSCFCAELQALQFLFPNSASGIAGAFLLYIFKFSDSTCRPLMSLSDNFADGGNAEGGSISCVRIGREWPDLGGLAPRHTQRPPTYRDPFFPRPCQKVTEKPTQYSLLQQLPRKTFDNYNTCIAMVVVKFRPRWPHTWRYALHSLSRPTMTSGSLG